MVLDAITINNSPRCMILLLRYRAVSFMREFEFQWYGEDD